MYKLPDVATEWHESGMSFLVRQPFYVATWRLIVNHSGGLITCHEFPGGGNEMTPKNWCWTGQLYIDSPRVDLTFTRH